MVKKIIRRDEDRNPNIERFLEAAKAAGIDLGGPVNEGALFRAYSEGRKPDPALICNHVDELHGDDGAAGPGAEALLEARHS